MDLIWANHRMRRDDHPCRRPAQRRECKIAAQKRRRRLASLRRIIPVRRIFPFARGGAPHRLRGVSSYTVFARKYRPKIFADVLGQEHITRTLRNAIEQNRITHAYIFVGPRGTGKTSTARIFAKALNCTGGPKADFDPEEESAARSPRVARST